MRSVRLLALLAVTLVVVAPSTSRAERSRVVAPQAAGESVEVAEGVVVDVLPGWEVSAGGGAVLLKKGSYTVVFEAFPAPEETDPALLLSGQLEGSLRPTIDFLFTHAAYAVEPRTPNLVGDVVTRYAGWAAGTTVVIVGFAELLIGEDGTVLWYDQANIADQPDDAIREEAALMLLAAAATV